jgi:5-methylcytosine-specific restriction endonuclease McrA
MYIKTKCAFCGNPVTRRKQSKSKKIQNHFCNLDCKAGYQKLAKPITKKWLYEQYITNGLDCPKIGILVSRDAKSVWNWLKDFGIPTRGRGGYTSTNCFKKGQKNPFEGMKHSEKTKKLLSDIAKKDGRVPYDPKIGSYMKGRKGKDTPCWKGGITPLRQSVYSSEEWVEAVKAVWKRDNAICVRCGKNHNTEKSRGTFHIHHIISFEIEKYRTDPSNLILLCKKCHLWIHSKKNIDKEYIKK